MKIGFCGTVSVGKSTLVKSLAVLPEFKDYHIATERSVYLRDQGIQLNTDSTLKGQFVFAAERSIELMKNNVLTDRSVYDVCAFTLSAKSISWPTKELFVELLMDLRNDYDVIFYVSPVGVSIENNGVRETNPEYRDKIDSVIRQLLEEYPPKRLGILEGTNEERMNKVLRYLH
jgi:hypothetical protein